MSEILRILAVYAHPDDELSAGGALARYAQEGASVTLACATRGEAATIYCDDCATPETLAAVRTRELACSCQALGIQRLIWLDWPDGGVQGVPEAWAVAQLVEIIRQERPHVIFTHPPHGSYPHPDHIGVHDRTLAAYHAAADAGFLPDAGPAWAAFKLYVRVIPAQMFDLIPGFRDYRVQLNGQSLPFFVDPPEHVHFTLDCTPALDNRMAAWTCHQSQHNPDGTFSTMPEELQRVIFACEYFRLLAHRLPADPGHHDRLEAGLPNLIHA